MSAPTVRLIQEIVCEHYGVSRTDLLSDRKERRITHARQMGYALARKLTGQSCPQIGLRFGRDHTTILYGAAVIEERAAKDPEVAVDLHALAAAVRIAAASLDRIGRPLVDIDPLGVAQAVMASARGAASVSADEIRALASAVLANRGFVGAALATFGDELVAALRETPPQLTQGSADHA